MYLNIEDLKKSIRGEVLTVVTREENNALQAIADAEAELESYLSARYDIAAELVKTPDDKRVTMVVKLVRDIALYNCYNIAAPSTIPEIRIHNYDNAIKFLRDCQSEKANITGLKRLNTNNDGSTSSSYIAYSTSSPKRTHHL